MGDFSKNKSHRVQLSRYLRGEDIVLRGVSALKYMELYVEDHFAFDVQKEQIFVYGKATSSIPNLVVEKVTHFDEIDYSEDWGIPCTTLNQVVHDMLENPQLMNQDALIESLANHYENEGHFNNIHILDADVATWEALKNSALAFYD